MAETTYPQIILRSINIEVEMMWKRVIVAKYEISSRQSPGGTEENDEKL
jgi:hypothetical protein